MLTKTHRSSWTLRGLRAVTLIGVLFAVGACGTEPDALPAGAEQMTALPDYQAWWARTEACSGLQGEFSSLRFYQVPGVSTFSSTVGTVVGLWTRDGRENRITVAGAYLDNELVVRHEMLHALLERTGHPQDYFVTKCGLTWASWSGDAGQTGGAAAVALHND
ncbi:MAG TPA: hypothetical protein VJN95_15130 [Gemmatimonadales bacterium]|nr:hypothetical protein [Gemmatimonadales bacterium]